MFKCQGTMLKCSTAYHPQTDGQTEVVNRSLEMYLRCFTSERPTEWLQWLPWAEFWYNTSYHSTIGTTPFKILYGRDPLHVIRYEGGMATTFDVDRYLLARDKALDDLREHFLRAQQIMKAKADGKRRDVVFNIGDLVYLKLRPYRQNTVAKRRNQKLAARYYGPFEVLEKIGLVAYQLKLPPDAAIHPVFHVSQLKQAIGNQTVETELPHDFGTEVNLLPKDVRGTHEVGGRREVLIAWEGAADGEETWEPFELMQQRFPLFHLEDKVIFRGGGDDTNEITKEKEEAGKRWGGIYVRKKVRGG